MNKSNWLRALVSPAPFSALLLGLTACGPQAFVPSGMAYRQTAAGSANIPPKVDVVLGVSMNGTMQNIAPGIQTEIPGFLQGLETSGWDYRFVSIPLGEHTPVDAASFPIQRKVSVSRYDTNTPESNWLSPFPGANYQDPKLGIAPQLIAPVFTVPTVASGVMNGRETGVHNQVNFLSRPDVLPSNGQNPNANFLRRDALLAVITLSNGDDRSGGNWVYDPYYNRTVWQSGGTAVDLAYRDTFIDVKQSASLVRYYSVVAHQRTSCRGYGTWSGIRYEGFASMLGGISLDICDNPVKSALEAVANHLQTVKLSFRKKFLVMGTEPNPASIRVVRYINGEASRSEVIPQSPTNGWTYVGYRANQNTIDAPLEMEPATGYMVELHGSAKLMGSDTADITYQNAGDPVSN
jgi:hypothetical protein